MSWLKDLFKPRQDNFTKLLIEQAAFVVKGLEALNTYVSIVGPSPDEEWPEGKVAEVKPAEAKGGAAKAADAKPADTKGNAGKGAAGLASIGAKAADPKSAEARLITEKASAAKLSRTEAMNAVRQFEKDADEVRRILISELNNTFVTPMDREDISALSRSVDDIIDYAWTTVQEMELLNVWPTEHLQRMVSLLHESACEIHLAMLRIKDHPEVATEHAQRAKALENRAERVYREALADLFDGPAGPKRVIAILKMREVYRHLSNAADRVDTAANIISDIVVKMT